MVEHGKYLMWGVIPVTFNAEGAWDVAVKNVMLKKGFYTVAYSLLRMNRAIEALMDERIEFAVPLVPEHEAWLYRLAKGLHLNTATAP